MCDIKIASKSNLQGLAAIVCALASRLENVSGIRSGQPRMYRGRAKIKFPAKWPEGVLPITVCDEFGERKIDLLATKRPAIQRILKRKLALQGIEIL